MERFKTNPDFNTERFKPRSHMGLFHIARSQHLPITEGTRRSYSQRSDLELLTGNNSLLEVTPMASTVFSAANFRQSILKRSDKRDQISFKSHEIEHVTQQILMKYLDDKEYEASECKCFSQLISAKILEELKQMGFEHYKMVAIVSIGNMKERPGIHFGSRCLWNKNTDNFVSVKYSTTSLFAVAMVYGMYF